MRPIGIHLESGADGFRLDARADDATASRRQPKRRRSHTRDSRQDCDATAFASRTSFVSPRSLVSQPLQHPLAVFHDEDAVFPAILWARVINCSPAGYSYPVIYPSYYYAARIPLTVFQRATRTATIHRRTQRMRRAAHQTIPPGAAIGAGFAAQRGGVGAIRCLPQ